MKTIQQQTGWKRPCPTMICQEHDVLLSLTDYSFDLDDLEFVQYFRSRTGIALGKEDKPELSRFLLTDPDAERWLLESPEYRYQLSGETIPFGKDREIAVKRERILKGRLQDCWELYRLDEKKMDAFSSVLFSVICSLCLMIAHQSGSKIINRYCFY